MKRQGIPKPLFLLQDRLARILNARYRRMTRRLMKELRAKLREKDIVTDSAPEDDNIESLLQFFEDMGKEIREENQQIADRANAQTIASSLETEWFSEDQEELERLDNMYEGDLDENFRPILDGIFKSEQTDYIKRLKADAGPKLKNIIESFEIDKNKFFEDNMEAVRKLYIDNSLARIRGEEDLLKRKIIKRITDYALGKSDKLILSDLTKACYEGSDHLSRLFARDQMQRFNKACTLSTFVSARVTKVKWVTAGDIRVRKSHKALNGQVFDINNLPEETDDYNCRCGLIPVEWADS